MTYYKIIQDNKVVDAGFSFLEWNVRRHRLYLCDEDRAQFVQSFDGERIFRDDWLKPFPETDIVYESAQVVVIDKNEFDEIRVLLDGDEQIPVLPDPVEEEQQESEPEKPAEEAPLSISDMRRLIQEQQEQIAFLTERLTEISNTIGK